MSTPRLIPADWGKKNNINFLRLALAFLVIFSHSYPLTSGNNDHEPLWLLFPEYATIGRLSVLGFFALSGLLISQSWLSKPDLALYAKRRFLRIWPGFFVASMVTLILFVPLGTSDMGGFLNSLHSKRILGTYFLRAIFLQSPEYPFGFEHNPTPHLINGSLWTIIYEFSWYGVVAALGLLGLLKKRPFVLGFAVFILLANWYVQHHFPLFGDPQIAGMTLAWWMIYGSAFVAGMAALAYREHIPRHPVLAVLAILSFIPAHFRPRLMLFLLPISFVYLLLYVAFSDKIKLQSIGSKVDLSYGVYLYAFAVEQTLVRWRPGGWSPIPLTLATAVLALPFALFSWFVVERPARDLFKGKPKTLEPEPVPVPSTPS